MKTRKISDIPDTEILKGVVAVAGQITKARDVYTLECLQKIADENEGYFMNGDLLMYEGPVKGCVEDHKLFPEFYSMSCRIEHDKGEA